MHSLVHIRIFLPPQFDFIQAINANQGLIMLTKEREEWLQNCFQHQGLFSLNVRIFLSYVYMYALSDFMLTKKIDGFYNQTIIESPGI